MKTDAYQKEVFDFLTTPDNFESLAKAVSHYELIRKELIQQLWTAVKDELTLKIKGTPWKLQLDNNVFSGYSKLILFKTNWMANDKFLFTITWENLAAKPFRGLLLYMDNPIVQQANLREKLKSIKKPDGFISEDKASEWWIWWSYATDLDFYKPESIALVLPTHRPEKAKELATDLLMIANQYESVLDKMTSDLSPTIK